MLLLRINKQAWYQSFSKSGTTIQNCPGIFYKQARIM